MQTINPSFWKNKKVLLTGHTGFKGGWLALWLQSMGADLCGIALPPPTEPSLFKEAKIYEGMASHIADIRDYSTIATIIKEYQPQIVFHMAAQPLVRYSYKNPIETYETNVMGTIHLFEAILAINNVKVFINVTSDKCYENTGGGLIYDEGSPMGGHDPYSSSKGCAEIATSSYRRSFFKDRGIALASVRAGNVIGGGDWALDRLVPDTLRAIQNNSPIILRNPKAIRPWQHVLEPLSGYLLLAEKLFTGEAGYDGGWNFGPSDQDVREVQFIVERLINLWGASNEWMLDASSQPHEAGHLMLNAEKAKLMMQWEPRWDMDSTLEKIVEWHRAWLHGDNVRLKCLDQISQYQNYQK